MKIKILLLLSVVLLTSCLTQKKKLRIAKEVMNDNRVELAKLCTTHFQPRVEYKEGKVIHTSDTTYLPGDSVPCHPNSKGDIIHVKCPDKPVIRDTIWKTDTAFQIDDAALFVLTDSLLKEKSKSAILDRDLKKTKKILGRFYWAIGLIIGGVFLFIAVKRFI